MSWSIHLWLWCVQAQCVQEKGVKWGEGSSLSLQTNANFRVTYTIFLSTIYTLIIITPQNCNLSLSLSMILLHAQAKHTYTQSCNMHSHTHTRVSQICTPTHAHAKSESPELNIHKTVHPSTTSHTASYTVIWLQSHNHSMRAKVITALCTPARNHRPRHVVQTIKVTAERAKCKEITKKKQTRFERTKHVSLLVISVQTTSDVNR